MKSLLAITLLSASGLVFATIIRTGPPTYEGRWLCIPNKHIERPNTNGKGNANSLPMGVRFVLDEKGFGLLGEEDRMLTKCTSSRGGSLGATHHCRNNEKHMGSFAMSSSGEFMLGGWANRYWIEGQCERITIEGKITENGLGSAK